MLHGLFLVLLSFRHGFFVGLLRYLFDWSVRAEKQSDDRKTKRDGGQIDERRK